MIVFKHPELIKKYGSWVKVQVAFYDFLFTTAISMCAKNIHDTLMLEIIIRGFKDGDKPYERLTTILENMFSTEEQAWEVFLRREDSSRNVFGSEGKEQETPKGE